jgi:hypothetical protein
MNFARHLFSRVTLVRITASSFARHFLQAGVFIFGVPQNFRAESNHTLPSRSPGREKSLESGLRVVPTPALARANASGPFRGVYDGRGLFQLSSKSRRIVRLLFRKSRCVHHEISALRIRSCPSCCAFLRCENSLRRFEIFRFLQKESFPNRRRESSARELFRDELLQRRK